MKKNKYLIFIVASLSASVILFNNLQQIIKGFNETTIPLLYTILMGLAVFGNVVYIIYNMD